MEIKQLLQNNNFNFKKQFGQNFITDTNLLKAIVKDAEISKEDTVAEVGLGAGTLTKELAAAAKNVVGFEIDKTLEPILAENLSGADNVKIQFCDALKLTPEELAELLGNDFKVVANLPYYITTPLVFMFLELPSPPKSMSVMVQKEVALRFAAKENTADYGAPTVIIQSMCDVSITRMVNRNLFYPVPNVDSAIVKLDLNLDKFEITDRATFSRLAHCAFAMRRKTLVNNMMSEFKFSREKCESLLTDCKIDTKARGETLSVSKFVELSNKMGEPPRA